MTTTTTSANRGIDDVNIARLADPTIKTTRRPNIYRGFSTVGSFGRSFRLTDVELVKRDLLNHIYTLPGERIGNPGFGTLIPVIAFEAADQATLNLIESELRKVANADPRVELVDIAVAALPNTNSITAIMDLKYIELDGEIDRISITLTNNG